MVGNKIDFAPPRRVVDREAAERYAKSKNLKYFESSAKNNVNIDEIFYHLTELGLEKKLRQNKKEFCNVNLT